MGTKVITRITITSPSTDTRKITITSQSTATIADMIADTIAITATLPTVKTPTVNLTTTPEEGLTTITLTINAFTTSWPIITHMEAMQMECGCTESFVT